MDSVMKGAVQVKHRCQQCQSKVRPPRPRHLHQSTFNLGSAHSTGTHPQTYSGLSADDQPLLYRPRQPSFPSLHHSHLDLSDSDTQLQRPPQSHVKEVYRPQHMTVRVDMRMENWARYCSGQAVKELTSPQDVSSEYCSTYMSDHRPPGTGGGRPQLASGRPTHWHQHDILTGEQRQQDHLVKSSRRSRHKLLLPSRRWETQHSALRLY